MKICSKCLRELQCIKNGMILRWHGAHCYAGDKYTCPGCGATVVLCNATPFHSEKLIRPELVIDMPEEDV